MSIFKSLLHSNQTEALMKTQSSIYKSICPSPSFIIRTLTSSNQKPTKKPLSLLFQGTVGLTEKAGGTESQSEGEKNEGINRQKPKKVRCLGELFGGEKKDRKMEKMVKPRREREEPKTLKDLSQLAEIFIRHLYAKGYFNQANFLEDKKLGFGYFENSYGRDFIKFAAYEFGKDHQEIARWLSGNHLKKVVLLGCPSLDKNNVFAAKRLRKFFKIQENTVCSRCILKDSCQYANKSVWGIGTNSLILVDVMKVITLYALDQVPAKLPVPDEVKDSVNQLLKIIDMIARNTSNVFDGGMNDLSWQRGTCLKKNFQSKILMVDVQVCNLHSWMTPFPLLTACKALDDPSWSTPTFIQNLSLAPIHSHVP